MKGEVDDDDLHSELLDPAKQQCKCYRLQTIQAKKGTHKEANGLNKQTKPEKQTNKANRQNWKKQTDKMDKLHPQFKAIPLNL